MTTHASLSDYRFRVTCLMLNPSTIQLFTRSTLPPPLPPTAPSHAVEGNLLNPSPPTLHPSITKKRYPDYSDVGKAWFSDTLRAGFAFAHSAPLRKSAFTLAEVLITLGIIGVVAAMTLPALINKTQHQELQTGLKKNYTVLQQALLRAQLDTGEVVKPANYQKVDEVTKGSPLKKLMIKYIKNAQDCGEGTEKGSCIANCSITGNENAKNPYITFNAKNSVIPNWLDDGQFITTDGTLFLLESAMGDGSTVYPILITVDVNGVQKRPNRWGYDLFTFQLTDSGKLLPVGAEGTSYTDMSKYCSLTNTSNQNGVGCTYKTLTDKDYWKNLQ